jgi:phage N-6-adenine-methyltransferase
MVQSELIATRFDTTDVVPLMTADEAASCEMQIVNTGNRMRALVYDFDERKGWAALGHASYSAWVSAIAPKFGYNPSRLFQELTAARLERTLTIVSNDSDPIPESHLRPLAPYKDNPDAARAIWDNAHRTAEAEGVEHLTARHVKDAVREWRADDQDVFTDPEADEYQTLVEGRKATPPMAVHFTSNTPEWYTPERIIDLVIEVFGQIDLDPCSNSDDPGTANVPARKYYTAQTDGLAQQWFGKVYMNPPYGDEIGPWIEKLVSEFKSGRVVEAITLVPARTDTAWIQPLYDYALCFVRGRLKFVGAENSAPFPSLIVYLGPDNDLFMDCFEQLGRTGCLR